MLTLAEKILFVLAALASAFSAFRIADRIIAILRRGHGKPDWDLARERLASVAAKILVLQPTFSLRLGPSLFHALIAWGFIYYLLVNLGDALEGLIPGFQFLGQGRISGLYRLTADLLSVGVLVGMLTLLARRFLLRSPSLTVRPEVLLHPKARAGIRRDSAIVGGFILVHVGSRFIGQSISLAYTGQDPWQPFASILGLVWSGASPTFLLIAEHVFFWLALGTILAFNP